MRKPYIAELEQVIIRYSQELSQATYEELFKEVQEKALTS
jgi:hypothetical protein